MDVSPGEESLENNKQELACFFIHWYFIRWSFNGLEFLKWRVKKRSIEKLFLFQELFWQWEPKNTLLVPFKRERQSNRATWFLESQSLHVASDFEENALVRSGLENLVCKINIFDIVDCN